MKKNLVWAVFSIFLVMTMLGCKPKQYRIKLHSLDGNASQTIEFKKSITLDSLPILQKAGYIFAGWYYDLTFKKKVTFPVTFQENTELYAGWYNTVTYSLDTESDTYIVTGGFHLAKEIYIYGEYNGKKVTKIADHAFEGMKDITKVTLPDTIKEIGNYAFSYCSSLETINLPDGLEKVGIGVFDECNALQYEDINGLKYINHWLVDGKSAVLSRVELEPTIKGIFPYAFSENQTLTSLTIPENVKAIFEGTFQESSIKELTLSKNVEFIDITAFAYTYYFTGVHVEGSNFFYEDNGVLYNKEKTKLILYPSARENKQYTVLNTVETIGKRACMYNPHLEQLHFPSQLKKIEEKAVFKCENLTTVSFGNQLEEIEDEAFRLCKSLEEIHLPSTLYTIGENVFKDCNQVEKATIPFLGNNTTNYTLGYLFGLTTGIPTTLKELVILGGEKIVGASFQGATSLTSIVLPSSIKSITAGAFVHCPLLRNLNLEQSEYYKVMNGVLYSKDGTTLVCYPAKRSGVYFMVPSTVTTVLTGAFHQAEELQEIQFSEGLTQIQTRAFENLPNLRKVILPTTLNLVGQDICYLTPKVTIYSKASSRGENWSEGWNTLNYPVVWDAHFPTIVIDSLEYHIELGERLELNYRVMDAPEQYNVKITLQEEGIVELIDQQIKGVTEGIVTIQMEVEGYSDSKIYITIIVGNPYA